ncbi:MAG: methyltransferase domain-containing protein [Candidatus Obscuribacterales bacterium]|jgi:SAM-dependent methyltransferase|nr:methyltransferase domain-containing protein [Candidatus Obscuribacterales bacterium]
MKPSALPYLACIHCKGGLHLEERESKPVDTAEGREIMSGTLTCTNCLKQYAITGGVPRMIDAALSSSVDLTTGDRFADAWKEFPRLVATYKKQFYDWIYPVDEDFIKNKIVLEAGCGKGRHAQLIAESGAKMVFAIDIGDAIDVAFHNVGHMPQLHLVQADIRKLPFKHIFEYAFSVGVLHHMEDPQAGFSSVVDCLAPGGSVSIWVYGKENNWWITNLISPVREAFTAKLPASILKIISTTISIPLYGFSAGIASPYSALRKNAKWLPEMFYETYLAYIGKFDFTEVNHIVFDHLIAPVAYYIPEEEVREWYMKAGFDNPVVRWHNKNSWCGFASKLSNDTTKMSTKMQKKTTQNLRITANAR